MIRLVTIILAAGLLWAGYWVVGATAVEKGLGAWLDARRAEGWVADYSALSTAGFPNRFDTTLSDLHLADPDTGVAWDAPFFQIFALSYKPHHIIAVWPPSQALSSPLEKLALDSEVMRASVVFEPGTDLVLERSSFELQDLSLISDQGWSATLEEGSFATRQSVGAPLAHDIAFSARNVVPSASALQIIDPGDLLPDAFETLSLDATVTFDAPWDRFAIEDKRPQITALKLKILKAQWGQLDLWAAGALEVDAEGYPTGKITVKAKNWREMLQIGVGMGLIPEDFAPTLESGLGLLAQLSGNPATIDAPLNFDGRTVSFGPIPLGPAPRLVLR